MKKRRSYLYVFIFYAIAAIVAVIGLSWAITKDDKLQILFTGLFIILAFIGFIISLLEYKKYKNGGQKSSITNEH